MISNQQTAEMLYNMMKLSGKHAGKFAACEAMIADGRITMRAYAVEWMKKVLRYEDRPVVDLSIQIFDRYLTCAYSENSNALASTQFLSITAACSVILSLKLLDSQSRQRLAFSCFSAFDAQALITHEVKILNAIHGDIFPNCTPSSFVSMIVKHSPLPIFSEDVMLHVDELLHQYEEEPEFLMFAPSTIAICAILVALSNHHIACDAWLDSLPDFCLPKNLSTLPTHLNLDRCMESFERIPMLRELASLSPTGVADM